jgi:hypothetical protein
MRRLVVVGNGMAGIRAIEEVLARTGADMSEITVFGDEPYGNYNRILLSNSLPAAMIRRRSTSTGWIGTPTTGSISEPGCGWYGSTRSRMSYTPTTAPA